MGGSILSIPARTSGTKHSIRFVIGGQQGSHWTRRGQGNCSQDACNVRRPLFPLHKQRRSPHPSSVLVHLAAPTMSTPGRTPGASSNHGVSSSPLRFPPSSEAGTPRARDRTPRPSALRHLASGGWPWVSLASDTALPGNPHPERSVRIVLTRLRCRRVVPPAISANVARPARAVVGRRPSDAPELCAQNAEQRAPLLSRVVGGGNSAPETWRYSLVAADFFAVAFAIADAAAGHQVGGCGPRLRRRRGGSFDHVGSRAEPAD